MRSLLLDTCIWIDNYLGGRPQSEASRALIDHSLENDIDLLYSASSANNIAYAIESHLKSTALANGDEITPALGSAIKSTAVSYIENLEQIATAVAVDEIDLSLARRLTRIHPDFEDCVVVAGVERSKAAFLVTNDMQLIKHAPCAAMTPADMLTYLKTGTGSWDGKEGGISPNTFPL